MASALRKRKLMGEINVVPYIDVMLVLLIIFMVTAPLLTQGIEVELPKTGAEPIEDSASNVPFVLSVDAAGNLYLNVGDDEENPVGGKEIIACAGPRRQSRHAYPGESGSGRALRHCRRCDGSVATGWRGDSWLRH